MAGVDDTGLLSAVQQPPKRGPRRHPPLGHFRRRRRPCVAVGAAPTARRLRPPAPALASTPRCSPWSAGRPAPASRPWSTRSSGAGVSRSGVLRPTTTSPGARAPPRRPALVRRRAASCPASRASPARTRRPTATAGTVRLVESSSAARRAWPCSTPPTSTRSSRANRALATPAALRRRPLALRHHGGPLRGCRALGPAAHRRRTRHRPSRSCSTGCRPRPWTRSAPTSPSMLREQGLPTAPIFTVPETTLDADGLLRRDDVARLRSWLRALASDARARSIVVAPDARGARRLAVGPHRRARRRPAATEQDAAAAALRKAVDELSYEAATEGVEHGHDRRHPAARRGARPLAGVRRHRRVLPAGRDDDLALARPHHRRHQGQPAAGRGPRGGAADRRRRAADVSDARGRGVRDRSTAWRRLPGGGPELLAAHPDLAKPAPESCGPTVERLVRDWQGEVLELVRGEGKDRRTTARIAAYGLNGDRRVPHARRLQPAPAGSPAPRSASPAAPRSSPSACSRRSSATRPCARWRTRRAQAARPAEELYAGEQARVHAAVADVEASAGPAADQGAPPPPWRPARWPVVKMGRPGGIGQDRAEAVVVDLTAPSAESVRPGALDGGLDAGGRRCLPSTSTGRRRRRREGRGAHRPRRWTTPSSRSRAPPAAASPRLFNALVGTDVATVGARRPTTSTPTAAVWGDEPRGDCSTGSVGLVTWSTTDARRNGFRSRFA